MEQVLAGSTLLGSAWQNVHLPDSLSGMLVRAEKFLMMSVSFVLSRVDRPVCVAESVV